ncbi:HAMP domain-containing sensor histidine kinase [Mucilaginibacter myungsuensis]|uniref:sensor histidine kinase n=1 Tax=Mucilaginibacter myungsuensis TaxID=649104 RepID=UPI0025B5891A|nr:HAMP domain-containing sensor histidine kinase [Mucilaginibacter myungsuensis]MDN3600504.1 HAMP domain-containing sensor histidine kinase [Mucilaginibacter myungsuensis]
MTIQKKVAWLFFALTSGGIILFSAAVFYFEHQFNFEDFYKRLEARVNIAADVYQTKDLDSAGAVKDMRQRFLERLPSESQYIIKPADRLTHKFDAIPENFLDNILADGKSRYKTNNTFYAGKVVRLTEGDLIFVVSAKDPYGLKELDNLEKILIVGFVVLLVLVYIIGTRFSFHTFKPVRNIIKKVNTITANNLHLRLDGSDGNDEIAELTRTFNDMLNRLETAFETQNNFVSNASHELRTPLSIIKGEAELALKHVSPDDTVNKQALSEILKGAKSLQDMITSLLGLAQTGFDGKKQNWEPIRADELVWDIKKAADHIVAANNITVDLSELPEDVDTITLLGNVHLLKLAISNIVLNACKYSDNKAVIIKLFTEKGRVVISVKDQGIGIPEEDIQHIFEPFFRASNTGKFDGHGVGLPLALNIIRLHKGTIAIISKVNMGADIRIALPAYHPKR